MILTGVRKEWYEKMRALLRKHAFFMESLLTACQRRSRMVLVPPICFIDDRRAEVLPSV